MTVTDTISTGTIIAIATSIVTTLVLGITIIWKRNTKLSDARASDFKEIVKQNIETHRDLKNAVDSLTKSTDMNTETLRAIQDRIVNSTRP